VTLLSEIWVKLTALEIMVPIYWSYSKM